MKPYHYDSDSDDGAIIKFAPYKSKVEAEKEYAEFIQECPKEIDTYPDVDEFMLIYHGCILEDGYYGNYENTIGMYDWCEVGGRWAGLLPGATTIEELTELVNEALDIENNEEAHNNYRDNIQEYLDLKSMSIEKASMALNIGGEDTLIISKRISAEVILERFKMILQHDGDNTTIAPNQSIVALMINTMIIDGVVYKQEDDNFNDQFFIQKYNHFLELNEQYGEEYNISIVDCHT